MTCGADDRWDGGNTTEATDKVAVGNLIAETPQTVKRFVLTTSAGVTRSEQFPFSMMNFFSKYKIVGVACLNIAS